MNAEWSGLTGLSIISGTKCDTSTGVYGIADAWGDLTGGASQINAKLSMWVLEELHIVTNVTDGITVLP